MHLLLAIALSRRLDSTRRRRSSPRPSFVVGNWVQVLCADTEASWRSFATSTTAWMGFETNGSAVPGGTRISLSPSACGYFNHAGARVAGSVRGVLSERQPGGDATGPLPSGG